MIGGRLFQNGFDVLLIARGEHGRVIRDRGLRIEDPDSTVVVQVPSVASCAEVSFRAGDAVLLATKSQDAKAALDELRHVAPPAVPVLCATNGVEVERLALRLFPNVYAINVLIPTAYLEPGVVQIISAPLGGALDVGRYPAGIDDLVQDVAGQFRASGFASDARTDIMRSKYRKLVLNSANAVEAAFGFGTPDAGELARLATLETERVLAAAGIDVATAEEERAKVELMQYRPINGVHRGGGSTWQSLRKGGSVETDYLNGEVVLLGRLHGTPTPVNELLQQVLSEMSRSGELPGSRDPGAALRALQVVQP